jgi:hypothetical protein
MRALNSLGKFTVYNNYLYIIAQYGLYKTDGTPTGLRLVYDSLDCRLLTPHNGYLYFAGKHYSPNDYYLAMYRLDENDNVVKITPDLNLETHWVYSIGTLGQSLYMSGTTTPERDVELWKLDDFPNNVKKLNPLTAGIIYPNPANNSFSIKSNNDKNTTVTISSLTGQLLLQTTQTKNISIASLPADTYMVQITNNGKTTVEKLIKE